MTRGEFQRLCLWYLVKESRHLLYERQNGKKIGLVTASFPLSTSQSLVSQQIGLRKDKGKIIKYNIYLAC